MSSQAKTLVPKQNIAATVAVVYTSPAGGKGAYIDACDLVNHGGGTPTVTLSIVESGDTLSDVNHHVIDKSISHKATEPVSELMGRYIAPGATLHAVCSVATTVSIYVTGRELT